MTIRNLTSQDRRTLSRIIVCLDCQFTYSGTDYSAVIVDLSHKGALLSAKFMPPTNSYITVSLQTDILERKLELKSRVVRGDWVESGFGKMGRFALRFENAPLDLIRLINKLLSSKSST